MNQKEQQSILALCLMAAFADGAKDERERAEIKRIADSLAGEGGVNVAALYQDVLLKRVTLEGTIAQLESAEARQLAYEMAVCVCDADGTQSEAERAFLAALRAGLKLDAGQAQTYGMQAEEIAAAGAGPVGYASTLSNAELDQAILDASILNGALELLPESLATMAIIPLQMKLVYGIGKSHGFELDRGHVKDFLATAGVGLSSQYLEQAGRRLLGGLLGRLGGGLLGGIGKQAISSGMSFASTYALGHVAKRYYAGGRTLSAQTLREAFAAVLAEAKDLYGRHVPEIQAKARTLDVSKLATMVRGG